jgi:hypothetical protein
LHFFAQFLYRNTGGEDSNQEGNFSGFPRKAGRDCGFIVSIFIAFTVHISVVKPGSGAPPPDVPGVVNEEEFYRVFTGTSRRGPGFSLFPLPGNSQEHANDFPENNGRAGSFPEEVLYIP